LKVENTKKRHQGKMLEWRDCHEDLDETEVDSWNAHAEDDEPVATAWILKALGVIVAKIRICVPSGCAFS
jgi:hypothetical protein